MWFEALKITIPESPSFLNKTSPFSSKTFLPFSSSETFAFTRSPSISFVFSFVLIGTSPGLNEEIEYPCFVKISKIDPSLPRPLVDLPPVAIMSLSAS